MIRPALIELRRSNAPALALTVAVAGAAWLASNIGMWLPQWTVFTHVDSSAMFVLVPVVLAGGAMLGRRERHTRAEELTHSTGRPRWQRVTPGAAALAIAVTAAHLLLVAVGATVIAVNGGYLGPRGLLPVLVDVTVLVGAAWLGIAAGRAWSSPLLPPALAATALVVQLGAQAYAGPRDTYPLQALSLDGREPGSDWETLTGTALLGRLGLGLGLVLGGWLLTAGAAWLTRAGGLAAVAAGLALIVAITPIGEPGPYRMDPASQQLVCADGTPQVCVTAVHAHLLPSVTPQARAALEKLARLPDAPTRAVEWHAGSLDTGADFDQLGDTPKTEPGTVFFRIDVDDAQRGEDTDIEASILNGAGTTANGCTLDDREALWAAGAWFYDGDTLPLRDWVFGYQLDPTEYQPILAELRKAPEQEQVRRVTALRDAAGTCDDDLTPILTGERAS